MSVTWAGQSVAINASSTSTVSPGVAASPTGPASGDLAGSYPGPTVDGLQGRPLAATAPTTGQVIVWDGSQWEPGAAPVVSDATKVDTTTAVSAGTGLTGGGTLSSSVTLAVDFGTTAGEVCEGNDARLSDSRTPTGSAGGDLAGTYPNPTVAARAIGFSKIDLDPRTGLLCYTDCFAAQDFTNFNSGTGTSVNFAFNGVTDRFGIARCTTGTTATGRAAIGTSASNAMYLGSGLAIYRAAVSVVALSDGTNRFIVQSGWTDSTVGTPTDAVRFYYTDTAGPEWQCETRSNGTSTITAVGSSIVAGQWYVHDIVVNAAGTSVEFYLDGTLVATHTTDIPTGLARMVGIHTGINKTLGTTARNLDVDYIILRMDMNR